MGDNKQTTQGNGIGCVVIVVILILVVVLLFSSCGSSSDDYEDMLRGGLDKYYSGETLTNEEQRAVDSYLKWKAKQ